MHYLVYVVVEAKDEAEANSRTDYIMMDLVEQKEFDWYSGDHDESRWEDCWKPMRLTEKKAQTLLQDAMRWQFDEFKNALATIRLMIDNYTDEQIFNEEFQQVDGRYLSRYQFSRASGYHANACQLFGEGGDSITSQKQLEWYLKDTARLWVVQVDCHN